MIAALVAVLLLVGCVEGGQKCSGSPRRYNGKLCGSTTNYHDSFKGACGCGHGNTPFRWNQDHYVAAASQMFFDSGRKTWCGSKCGHCVKLTTTGGFVDGHGKSTGEGQSKVFMVTNLCPAVSPNMAWCAQPTPPWEGGQNTFGYAYHFDLENGGGQVSRLGWDNPEVTVDEIDCNHHEGMTPNDGFYRQCECPKVGP
ncbi:endoglucanase-like [Mizuhopecten yessoensis]|uniref:endoglucanase-like n=1 Tax=Mizuhopecten yessoensis TaxID=6573 RepID=UPI000B459AEF|nr:endoglucanase-like [Mizuhopecten yessoensis]